jgi:hypothetical protein
MGGIGLSMAQGKTACIYFYQKIYEWAFRWLSGGGFARHSQRSGGPFTK